MSAGISVGIVANGAKLRMGFSNAAGLLRGGRLKERGGRFVHVGIVRGSSRERNGR